MRYLNRKPKDQYYRMIQVAAERLYHEFGKEGSKIIIWEDFRENYIKDKAPKNDGEYYLYVQRRTNYWAKDINEYFVKHKYPCRLAKKKTGDRTENGVQLLTAEKAVNERYRFRMRQLGSFYSRTKEEFEQLAPVLPKSIRKQVLQLPEVLKGYLFQIYGAIDANRVLSRERKEVLKSALLEYLEPDDEDNEE